MIDTQSLFSKLEHDGPLTIATGRSRKTLQWKNREMLWSELVQNLSKTTRTRETFAEYRNMPKAQQDELKDVGGFVGGTLTKGRRKRDAVAWRHVLTLDADFIRGDFWASVETMLSCSCVAYSTHSHSPKSPRMRLVIPLARPVSPDEYQAVSRRIAADLGMDFFDDTTYQPHRLMYWPSTSADGEYIFEIQDEPWLNPDEVLARYPDWTDQSYWPESSRTQQARKRQADKQGDPCEKPGIIGAFCRTYSIEDVLAQFLSDVYAPCEDPTRYTYIPGSSSGGLVIYDGGKFAYSHHGTDPIGGNLVNAFDLVRLHKFGLKDEDAKPETPTVRLPSYLAMLDFAKELDPVKMTLAKERLDSAKTEFEVAAADAEADNSWMLKLQTDRKGQFKSTIDNVQLILDNDPNLTGKIAFNEFSHRTMARKDLPWRKLRSSAGDGWDDSDDAALRHYIESVYDITSPAKIADALLIVQDRHRYHPVREYLESITWDEVPRIDTLLIDYLGAEDSEYTRAVTRKALAAAVARVFRPGVKYDYMLVMVGAQGIGKSHILSLLGQQWFSDSITTVQGKEAYEQLQDAWIIEMAELAATRKAESEAIKHFISKREDIYRVAYGKRTTRFPRQSVFFGTTNDQEFLRDRTGNRRFWPVEVGLYERKKSLWKDMNQEEIDQIWAEALAAWKAREPLYLESRLEKEAKMLQDKHVEESPKAGLVREFLEKPLPDDWEGMDIVARRSYLHNRDFGEPPEGSWYRQRACVVEIWAELFEGDPKQLTPIITRELHGIMRNMEGWESHKSANGKLRFGEYGLQKAYVRENFLDD